MTWDRSQEGWYRGLQTDPPAPPFPSPFLHGVGGLFRASLERIVVE